jgi:hypothetical protein
MARGAKGTSGAKADPYNEWLKKDKSLDKAIDKKDKLKKDHSEFLSKSLNSTNNPDSMSASWAKRSGRKVGFRDDE